MTMTVPSKPSHDPRLLECFGFTAQLSVLISAILGVSPEAGVANSGVNKNCKTHGMVSGALAIITCLYRPRERGVVTSYDASHGS
ncbi:hypothetical protein BaRGS_00011081 [Batillaria attramentaria]|uniref:Uncharacterized protein n=1 Tax=Batillaria attramentaria TaxID=370345 RepID=A0ABD0LET5_9CAEN